MKKKQLITYDDVRDKIVEIRGQQCILDFAVAELYGVETRDINKAVKNNPRKFPQGWVFELEKQELEGLRWKNSTTNLPNSKSRVLPKDK